MKQERMSAAASIRFEEKARKAWTDNRFGIEETPDGHIIPVKKIPKQTIIYDNSVGRATSEWYNRFGK